MFATRFLRSGFRGQLIAAMLLLPLVAIEIGSAPPARADTASSEISIVSETPLSQPSGSQFRYVINYTCAAVASSTCDGFQITIPLNSPGVTVPSMLATGTQAWNYSIETAAGVSATGAISGSNYVITFSTPVATGISQSLRFIATPPNIWTADGTSWSLLPTASGTGIPSFSAPAAVVSTATAEGYVTVAKTVQGGTTSLQPGATVVYNITPSCAGYYPPPGRLAMTSGSLVDTLPATLHYVSSSPTADQVSGNVLTWNLDTTTLPEDCRGGGTTPTFSVTATVDDGVADGTTITNNATFNGLPLAQTQEISSSTQLSLPVVAHPDPWRGGTLSKISKGALGVVSGLPATYAGNWITPISPSPNLDYATVEGQYVVNATLSSPGFRKKVVDPLPCLDNETSPLVYSSLAPSDAACENPAFHPTVLAIQDWNAAGSTYPDAYAAGWRPEAVLTDGSTVQLQKTSEGSTGNWTAGAFFAIPPALRDQISTIVLPDSGLLLSASTIIYIAGYADASIAGNAKLANTVSVTPYWRDSATAEQTRTSSSTLLIAPPAVRLGITKYGPNWSNSVVAPAGSAIPTSLAVSATSPTPITTPLVVTDLLPIGLSWTATPTVIWTGVNHPIVSTVEVIDNFQGSGRQLLRFTIPADSLGAGPNNITAGLSLVTSTTPGTLVNTAEVFAPGETVDSVCQSGVWSDDDPLDLAGTGKLNDPFCSNTMSVRTTGSGLPGFQIQKSVQGDLDPTPRFYPAVGVVNPNGGSAAYEITWTNTGGSDLKDVVVYDVLPHIGDTGTLNITSPRNSGFTPRLQSVGATPAGATVFYSASYDACRPELVAIPGCVNDWSTTPPGGDLGNVHAIKIASTLTYLSGQNMTFDFTLAVDPLEQSSLIAWNSAAGRASFPTEGGESSQPLIPTEGPKVGLQGSHPDITITKGDANGNTGDDPGNPVTIASGATTGLVFHVTNTGNQNLKNIDVTDLVTAGGGTVSGLDCDFLGDGSQRGTEWAGPFAVGASFDCTATLSALMPEVLHTDVGTVTANGALLDEPVTASDSYSARVTGTPGVQITKYVNGREAGQAPGVEIAAGSTASWTYQVRNTGDVPLANVHVRDDNGTPNDPTDDWDAQYVSGDTNGNGLLDLDEVWVFRSPDAKTLTVTAGLYKNVGTVTAMGPREHPVQDSDTANLHGAAPAIGIVKYLNDQDANFAPGVGVLPGSSMAFRYVVTNMGNTPLSDLAVTDDQGIVVSCLALDGTPVTMLAVGESVTCSANQNATFTGAYVNTATATARGPVTVGIDGTDVAGQQVSASDTAHAYLLPVPPGLATTGGDDGRGFVGFAVAALLVGGMLFTLRHVGRRHEGRR